MGLSSTTTETLQSDINNPSLPTNIPVKWVAKRDRHMQLINSNVYNNNVSDRSPMTQPTTNQINDLEDMMVEQSLQGGYKPANQSSLSALVNAVQQGPQPGVSGPKFESGNEKISKFRTSGNIFPLGEYSGI